MDIKSRTGTRDAIMDVARNTVMTKGYNALSFRDLAAEVGIKSASVHHHFPTKGDLAEALVMRFCEDFTKRMEPLAEQSFEAAVDGYVAMFRGAFVGRNRMCLGGMMSAEVSALPDAARGQLKIFADAHKTFLRTTLAKKHRRMAANELEARAAAIYAAMEGAQLVTRGLGGDVAIYDQIVASYRTAGLLG